MEGHLQACPLWTPQLLLCDHGQAYLISWFAKLQVISALLCLSGCLRYQLGAPGTSTSLPVGWSSEKTERLFSAKMLLVIALLFWGCCLCAARSSHRVIMLGSLGTGIFQHGAKSAGANGLLRTLESWNLQGVKAHQPGLTSIKKKSVSYLWDMLGSQLLILKIT